MQGSNRVLTSTELRSESCIKTPKRRTLRATGSSDVPYIGHPHDPEHKYLLHYSSESPFPQNFYSGNVLTDASGYAWVELPDYFEAINTNFKYQLTVVGKSFARAAVWGEISNNRFRIRTDAPNFKVSW